MTSFGDGKIEAFVGPVELGAADNLEQVIVDFIGGAKKTLNITIQEVDSRTTAQAILDARWRGVRVDMFIEQDYVRSELRGTPPTPPTPLPARRRRRRWSACSGSPTTRSSPSIARS